MTDLQISKALALAIGWKESDFIVTEGKLRLPRNEKQWSWQVFDYRDWKIIGPIAERCKTYPTQKAIALAVIGAKK